MTQIITLKERHIRNITIGVESDNLVEHVVFKGLPTIGEAQLVTLHWSLDDGSAGDVVGLTPTADGYAWDVGNAITQYGGKPISAYLRVTAGDQTWSTQSFRLAVHALPDIAEAVPITPTVIDQMLAAIQTNRDEMAAALARVAVASVSAVTLDAGQPATVEHEVTDDGVVLTIGVPRGAAGATGPKGDAGAAGEQGPQGPVGPNQVSASTDSAITGLLKGAAGKVAQAVAGADYATPQNVADAVAPVASQLDAIANDFATKTELQAAVISGVADGALTPLKTSFFRVDIADVTWTEDYFVRRSDGALGASESYDASDYIPINADGLTLVIGTACAADSSGVAFYDSNQAYLTGFQTGTGGLTAIAEHNITIPAGAKYFRFSCAGAKRSLAYVLLGDTMEKIVRLTNAAVRAEYDAQVRIAQTPTWTYSGYIRTLGTVASAIAAYGYTQINVHQSERFRLRGRTQDLCRLYVIKDANGAVLTYYPTTAANAQHDVTIEMPSGAAVLCVNRYNIDTEIYKLPVMALDYAAKIEAAQVLPPEHYKHLVLAALCIGDSLTAGAYFVSPYTGESIAENYPYYLGKITGWTVTNAATSGRTPLTWLANEGATCDYTGKQVVIICLGTNDGLTDTLAADTASGDYNTYAATNTGAYCKIIESILAANPTAQIFVTTVFAAGGSGVATTNSVINQIATKYNLPVIEFNDGSLYGTGTELLHPGGNNVHFGKVGNVTVAKKVFDAVIDYMADNAGNFEHVLIT